MTDLPTGWAWTTIGDVTEIQGGIQKQQKRRPVSNIYPFLRVANVLRGQLDLGEVHEVELFDGELEKYCLRDGDLLVVEGNGSPGHIGRAARWRGEIPNAVHQNHLIRLRPIAELLDERYLELVWNSPQVASQLRVLAGSTSGLMTLSVSKLKKAEIPLPPLAEQRRIVAALEDHLSRVDVGTGLVSSLLDRIDSFRDRVLAAAASGALIEQDMSKVAAIPEYAGVVDGDLPDVPASWEWQRLGEIADVVGGVTKDSKKQSDPSMPEVPYLRVANVQRGRLDLDDVALIRVASEKLEKLRLIPGDVLLNEGGDRDKLGRGWIWEGQVDSCIHQNHVFRARIKDSVLHPKLLAWHANGLGKRWFFDNGKQSVNLASISLSKVKLLPVPVPPLEVQESLVQAAEQYLSMFDETEQLLQQGLRRAEHLRQAVLREAFGGRLVAQDPADEPASALLERFWAERESAPKAKRGRKAKAVAAGPVREIDRDRPLPGPVGNGTQGALELGL
ncbi:restriction endonuclease subunit S [Saccharopolyspora hattusasensis]|uniref:restriction endonuclease subunit S n=1 Tax=Saccharopolyspora hattusasensis TaxID=1128679 RepID=UPI003D96D73D